MEKSMKLILDKMEKADQLTLWVDLNNRVNLQAGVITEALEEIKLYNLDQDHFGSIETLEVVDKILKKALK